MLHNGGFDTPPTDKKVVCHPERKEERRDEWS